MARRSPRSCSVDAQRRLYRLNRLRKNSVLYQGTTLVVPQIIENTSGFSP